MEEVHITCRCVYHSRFVTLQYKTVETVYGNF